MFKIFKKSKRGREEAIEVMKAFVSGKIMAEEFWEKFKADNTIKDILVEDEKKWEIPYALEKGVTGFRIHWLHTTGP